MRNVGKLLSANVIAQALGILVYPILTRMYSPEDFGLLNLFMSIVGVLVIVSTMQMQDAVVLPENEHEARSIVHICLTGIFALVFLITLTIPFADSIANLFNSPQLARYYWLLPCNVLLLGIWNVLNYWYIRHNAYDKISGYQISQSLFSAGFKTGFGALGQLNGGLIYSSILSPLCSILRVFLREDKSIVRSFVHFDHGNWGEIFRKYSNFPKYTLPHSLINYIAGQMPVLLLTPFFSSHEVGFWTMAVLLSFSPINVVTNALYQVFYRQTAAKVNARQSIGNFYRRFTIWTLVIIVPLFVCLWFVLPMLTQWLLGDVWRVTGIYIRWMLPWLVCNMLCGATGYIYEVFFKQNHGLYFEILITVVRFIGLGIGIYYNSFELSIACYAIFSAIVSGGQYAWLMYLVNRYEQSIQ